jgi:cytidine deaminase
MKVDGQALLQQAVLARTKAYVPYSHFQVGAALLDKDGNIHHGCNVENAAYGPTNCAERTALFRAIAVIGDTTEPITPCGVCRQVLVELCARDMPVFMGNLKGDWKQTTVGALLPGAFDQSSLDVTS